jgi:NAD(P)H dehydrogenase (quinone)
MPSNHKAAQRADLNYLGSFPGLMTQAPSDASPEEMSSGDMATAKAFGQRIVEVLALMKA